MGWPLSFFFPCYLQMIGYKLFFFFFFSLLKRRFIYFSINLCEFNHALVKPEYEHHLGIIKLDFEWYVLPSPLSICYINNQEHNHLRFSIPMVGYIFSQKKIRNIYTYIWWPGHGGRPPCKLYWILPQHIVSCLHQMAWKTWKEWLGQDPVGSVK
jgi:hypothetical protein